MRFLLILLTVIILYSQGFAASYQNKNQPTTIKSDLIDIKRKSQTINFIGNVRIEKGDDSMLSDKVTVFYLENENKTSTKAEKIKIIKASGNIRMFSKEFVATADKGSFDPNDNVFILEENVLVNKGASAASGEKFIYNVKTKKSKFIGEAKNNKTNDKKDKRAIVIIGGEDLKKD